MILQLDLGIKCKMLSTETKVNKQRIELKKLVTQLYEAFAPYASEDSLEFCLACYTAEQIDVLRSLPVSKIDTKLARKLLWEAKDHWVSSSVYKRFLPRILEVMSPPELEEDLFPMHLIEVFQQLGFVSWPDKEKMAVSQFLKYVAPLVYQDADDYTEFKEGLSLLK